MADGSWVSDIVPNTITVDGVEYYISKFRHWLDRAWILKTIKAQYWGDWRSDEVIMGSIHNSVCFGLYTDVPGIRNRRQVGFARVVTDFTTFSWLCDVVIEDEFRGKGLGTFLVGYIVQDESVKGTVSLLGTRDAHGLYEKFGYERCEQMKRIPKRTE